MTAPTTERTLAGRRWTRRDWEDLADDILDHGHRRLRRLTRRPAALGHWPASTDHLIGFSRSFLLASYRLACPQRPPVADLADRFGTELVARAQGRAGRRWPWPDAGQAAVYEAAILATALYESRAHVWDALAPADRDLIIDWLTAAHRCPTYDNNWALAPAVVAAFLASVGADHDREVTDRSLGQVERWYRGDGCFTDGPQPAFDHYWAWGIHQFLAQHLRMTGEADPTHRARLHSFLTRYRNTIDPTGALLHVGRSLPYRHAAVGVFWMGTLLDASPLSPAQTRSLATDVMVNFAERGAFEHGPSIGWHRRFEAMADPYTSPMSPYLCAYGFAGLVLRADHPAWSGPTEPWSAGDGCTPLGDTGQTLVRAGGVVRLAGSGTAPAADHRNQPDPRYAKLGYTSATAPEWGGPGRQEPDNEVVVVRSRRRHRRGPAIGDHDRAGWRFDDRLGGGTVRSVRADLGEIEIRVHRVTVDDGDTPVVVEETGYAVADSNRPAVRSGPSWVLCSTPAVSALTVSLLGHGGSGLVRHHGANPFGPHSAMARLRALPQADHLLVSAHLVRRGPIDPQVVQSALTVARLISGEIRVRYGTEDTVLDV